MTFINFERNFFPLFLHQVFLSTALLNSQHLFLLIMSPLDLTAFAPKVVSDTEKKITDDWKELLTRVEGHAMTYPEDKEELEDEIRYWVKEWAKVMVRVSDSLW